MFSCLSTSLFIGLCMAFAGHSLYALASLGDVHFPTSCKPTTQHTFDSGMALLHSFEFREAESAFRDVEKVDPKCVIAAWGVALSTTERAGANAPQKDLAKGWKELQPWLTVKAGTEREQMYVHAVRAMYEGYSSVPGSKRWSDYLELMRQLHNKYPDDINASLFYGLGLTWTAGAGEKGLEQRREALAIFQAILRSIPITRELPTTLFTPQILPSLLRSPYPPHANTLLSPLIRLMRSICLRTSSTGLAYGKILSRRMRPPLGLQENG